MSLLEDVFLEDEAGEAQELERVIEGDDLDDRPRTPDSNEASEKEDEAEEDKRVVDHTAKAKKVVKNPRFVLNPARLTGPRGIQVIPEHFKDFKFKGKGHEAEDLDFILKKLEHWAYRLYPKFKFDDCLKKIETLGKKRPVMVHLHKIRTDQYLSEETVQQQDSSGDEAETPAPEEDEFDRLLQQQIELARSTPAPGSVTKEMRTPASTYKSPMMLPKAVSSPSISDEQKERMIRNRKLAEEKRLARLNNTTNNTSTEVPETSEKPNFDNSSFVSEAVTNEDDVSKVRKQRNNVIDSDTSDDETNLVSVNESITVQVHNYVPNIDNSDKQNAQDMNGGNEEDAITTDRATEINQSDEINKLSVIEDLKAADVVHVQSNSDINSNESNKETATNDHKDTEMTDLVDDVTNEDHEDTEITQTDSKDAGTNDVLPNIDDEINNDVPNIGDETNNDVPNTDDETNNDVPNIDDKTNDVLPNIDDKKEVPENKGSGSVAEHLMDVDFTDDF